MFQGVQSAFVIFRSNPDILGMHFKPSSLSSVPEESFHVRRSETKGRRKYKPPFLRGWQKVRMLGSRRRVGGRGGSSPSLGPRLHVSCGLERAPPPFQQSYEVCSAYQNATY